MANDHKPPATGTAAATAPASGGKSGMIGVVAGGLVLVLVGTGAGFYIGKIFEPSGKVEAHDDHAPAEADHVSDPKELKELSLGVLITNITGDPHRYVKISCDIWVSLADFHHLEGAGGDGTPQIKKVIQMALEEQLKKYELADFTSRGIISSMSQDFQVVIENTLHAQFPKESKDHKFVKKVILNNMLVQ